MLKSLEPQIIWDFFCQISAIPRSSGHEDKIIAYLIDFAKGRSLCYKRDDVGNLVIIKEATASEFSERTIVLQSHVDMVCEKLTESTHDFFKDPIIPRENGGWVMASGTTLGADNGIGVAAALAILDSNNINHCRLEALFTIDEETGLTGAMGLKPDFITGSMLLNLDSEDDGEFYVGCAGGIDTVGFLRTDLQLIDESEFPILISISNLTGGHSGDDIGKGYHSANVILAGFLNHFKSQFPIRVASIDGGHLRNAIARDANALFLVPKKHKESVRVEFNCYLADIEAQIKQFDPNVRIILESATMPSKALSLIDSNRLIQTMTGLQHGVVKWSERIDGLVQTSTNFASIKQTDAGIEITTSQRSSSKREKLEIANAVSHIFTQNNFQVIHENDYPGWESDYNGELLAKAKESYFQLYGEYPKIKEIHAGLECGILAECYPTIEIISFGPTIKGAHSPSERIDVVAVERFWLLLKQLIQTLS